MNMPLGWREGRALLVLVVLVALAAGCTTMTGKTAGQNLDDATVTAEVKAKLAHEQVATLTKIHVDTNQGTVYLTGNVESEAMRARAAELARQVAGVREVVNNLKVQ
jgi:hyperosmotically inducible protein